MEYETKCKLCKAVIKIPVESSDDKACREMGINPEAWLGKLVCEECQFFKETGYRKPPKKSIFHFL